MNALSDLVDELGSHTKWHSVSIGVCTAHKSAGFFAMVFERDNVKCCAAEGDTPDRAAQNLLKKIRPRKMPGM